MQQQIPPIEAIGTDADFELKDQHGTPVRLSGFRGEKNVVLVFYPLAFSGVCTGELCALRDDFPEVGRDDVELLTVSVDSTWVHRIWAEQEGFEFGLHEAPGIGRQQMRHALGVHGGAPTQSTISGSQPQRRRFVRDGEVSVTVVRRDHQPDGDYGAIQLDVARQALRSETAARERAERSLAEARPR